MALLAPLITPIELIFALEPKGIIPRLQAHLVSCGDEKDDADDGDTLGPGEGLEDWKELLLKLLYLKGTEVGIGHRK